MWVDPYLPGKPIAQISPKHRVLVSVGKREAEGASVRQREAKWGA